MPDEHGSTDNRKAVRPTGATGDLIAILRELEEFLRSENPADNAANEREEDSEAGSGTPAHERFWPKRLLAGSPLVLYALDKEGTFAFSEGMGWPSTGLVSEEIAGRSVFDLFAGVPGLLDAVRRALSGEEASWTGPVGEAFYRNQLVPRVDSAGRVMGVMGLGIDLTDWKREHGSLKESRRRLATLMSTLPGMAYRCRNDRDWAMEFVSGGCTELTGFAPDDLLLGQPTYNELIHPEDREAVWSDVQQAVNARLPFELSYRIRTKDGREKTVWERGQGVWNAEGELLALEGFIQDVTEQRRTERALRESEDRFLAFFNSGMIGMIFGDLHGRILRANDEFLRIVGYSREDLESGGVRWDRLTPPEFIPLDKKGRAEAKRNGACTPYEKQYLRKDGSRVWVLVGYVLRGEARDETVAFVLDLTERKRAEEAVRESEERYRLLRDEASDMVIFSRLDGTILEANAAVEKVYGYSQQELRSMNVRELRAPETRAFIDADIQASVSQGGLLYETIHQRKDGTAFPVEISARSAQLGGESVVFAVLRDITERKKAREALADSERRYRLLFERNLAGVYRSTAGGRVIDCNDAFARIFGYDSPEEVKRLPAEAFYTSPADRQRFLTQLRKEGSLMNLESKGRRKDGLPIWMYENVSLLKDEETGEEIIEGTLFDISERKQAEEGLRKVSEEQQTIFDSIPATIWYKDCRNRFMRVNRAASDFIGLEPEQIENHTAEEIFPEFAGKYLKDDLEVIRSGKPKLGIVEQIRTARGDLRWVRTDKIPYREPDGEILGVIAFSIDITEAREAERERDFLFTAIEQAQEGIVVTSTAGTILYANRAMAELSGYDKTDLIGQNPRVLKSGRHSESFYKRLWDTILAGRVWRSQVINKRRDGTLYTAHLVISPVRDGSGKTTAFVCAQRDITHEIEMERRLQQAKTLETIGMLTNGVAHEVRNPLFAISTIVAALERKLGEQEEFTEYVTHIKDQSRRLNDLMNDLLTLGRPIRPSRFEPCLIRDLVKRSIKLVDDTHPGASRRCVLKVSEEFLPVRAEPDKLVQVFVNLLDNAFAFSPTQGRVAITIRAEGQDVSVSFADSGPGIAKDVLPDLFEPFQSRRKGGTGLGLAIVRQIVTAHGGSVEAANNSSGPGATFTVRLPVSR